jgi:hypothetical protein
LLEDENEGSVQNVVSDENRDFMDNVQRKIIVVLYICSKIPSHTHAL